MTSSVNQRKKLNAADTLFEQRYPGWRIKGQESNPQRLYVDLEPIDDPICPQCGRRCQKVHSRRERIIKDLPFDEVRELFIRIPVRRVRCGCGCRGSERLKFVEPRARLTNSLVASVQNLLRAQLPLSDVARHFGLSWDTVKTYDKLQLKYLYDEIDFRGVRHLAIDEFLLHKGHRYATVVMDVENLKVLWIGKGKSRQSLQPFFDLLRSKGAIHQIESVSCDMNAVYPRLFKENIPTIKIVYDLFHVIKNFGEVLKKARIKCEQLAQSKGACVKQSKISKKVTWLMLSRLDDLKVDRQELLFRTIEDNALLAALHPISQELRTIWSCKKPCEVPAKIEKVRRLLLETAKKFDFKEAKSFAIMLKRREEGIVWAGFLGFSTNRMEGANNKIKTLRRNSYGFRDHEYFFLKIKAALPGVRDAPWDKLPKGWAVLRQRLWHRQQMAA